MSEENKPRDNDVLEIIRDIAYTKDIGYSNSSKQFTAFSSDRLNTQDVLVLYDSLKARHAELLEVLKEISKEFGTDYADGHAIIAKEALDADAKASEK